MVRRLFHIRCNIFTLLSCEFFLREENVVTPIVLPCHACRNLCLASVVTYNTPVNLLSIGGQYLCNTAEQTAYAPPVGTYGVKIIRHKAQHRRVPMLTATDAGASGEVHRSYPLAIGNGIYSHRDGRIIVGKSLVPGCVTKTRETFMLLYHRINNSLRRGHEVKVRIIDP